MENRFRPNKFNNCKTINFKRYSVNIIRKAITIINIRKISHTEFRVMMSYNTGDINKSDLILIFD